MKNETILIIVSVFVLTIILCSCNMAGFESKKDCPDGYDIYNDLYNACYKCPSGYKYSKSINRCWKCPNGYRRNILKRLTDSKACNKKGIFKRNTTKASIKYPIRYVKPTVNPPPPPKKEIIRPNENNTFIISKPSDLNNSNIYGKTDVYLKGKIINDIFNVNNNYKLTIILKNEGRVDNYFSVSRPSTNTPHNFLNSRYYDKKQGKIITSLSFTQFTSMRQPTGETTKSKIEYNKENNNLVVLINDKIVSDNYQISVYDFDNLLDEFESMQSYISNIGNIMLRLNKDVEKIKFEYL